MEKITGTPIVEAYGLTEASPGVCCNPLNIESYSGSIGLPVPSTEVELRDANGKEVPVGQPGELWVKGPQVMQGYWNRPEETAKAIDACGFLETGDIAVMDEKGRLKLVDRKKTSSSFPDSMFIRTKSRNSSRTTKKLWKLRVSAYPTKKPARHSKCSSSKKTRL